MAKPLPLPNVPCWLEFECSWNSERYGPSDNAARAGATIRDDGYVALNRQKVAKRLREANGMSLEEEDEGVPVQSCIEQFIEAEQLEEKEAWYCSKCKVRVRATKKFDLWALPNVLIIHLKRFRYSRNPYSVLKEKIETRVTFPITSLDLGRYAMGPATMGQSAVYDLFAVSEHSGGLGGGHYTATARNFKNSTWYAYNDRIVTKKGRRNLGGASLSYICCCKRPFSSMSYL